MTTKIKSGLIADNAIISAHISSGAISSAHLSSIDTDNVSEGSSNLYFTTARARTSLSVTDSGGDGSLAYDNSTGAITYTGPSAAEVRAHLSAGTGVTYSSGAISIGQSVATTASPTFADINVTGNINVTGDLNTVSVTDLDVTDQTITLGAGQNEASSGGSGIVIDGSGASLLWDESNDEFDFNKGINVTGTATATNMQVSNGGKYIFGAENTRITGEIDGNGKIRLFTGGTEKVIIDGSNVGIGTSLPTKTLHIYHATTNRPALVQSGDADSLIEFKDNSTTNAPAIGATGNNLIFQTGSSASERLRIDSSGNLLVGTTDTTLYSATSGGGIYAIPNGSTTIARQSTGSTQPLLILNETGVDGTLQEFRKDGSVVGSISVSGVDLIIDSSVTDSAMAFQWDDGGTTRKLQGYQTAFRMNTANDADVDLGGSNSRWKDLYLSGTATMSSLEAGTATFEGAAVNINMLETNTTDVNTRFRLNSGDFIIQTLNDAQDDVTSRLAVDNATGDISFYEDTGSTAKFFWDASTERLGIGTTSPAKKLHISSGVNDTPTTFRIENTDSTIETNQEVNTIEFYSNDSSGSGTGVSGKIAQYAFNPGNQYGLLFSTYNVTESGLQERMRIDATGKVGIGTDSPTAPLHVDAAGMGDVYSGLIQNSTTDTDHYNVVRFIQGASGSATGFIGTGGSATGNAAFRNTFVVGTQTANSFVLATNDTERARIDSSGNVDITTGNLFTDTTSGIFFSGGIGSFTNGIYGVGVNNVAIAAGGAERFRIDSAGQMTQTGATNTSIGFTIKATATNDYVSVLQFNDNSGVRSSVMSDHYNNALIFKHNSNVERMRIDANGTITQNTTSASPVSANFVTANSNCDVTMKSANSASLTRLRNSTNDFQVHTNGTHVFTLDANGGSIHQALDMSNKDIGTAPCTENYSNSHFIKRYLFRITGDNVWRKVLGSFNDAYGHFDATISDTASGDVALYTYRITSPAYGVSMFSQTTYTNGGWNTGSFEFRIVAVSNTYQLECRYTSYYSTSNTGICYMTIYRGT
jgi:hypothetical protein